jgi:hypothetical protein
LKQEHLVSDAYVYGDVEYILDRIADAREEMLKLDLRKVKEIYIMIMKEYVKLKPEEQKKVYPELAGLYEERKKAEAMFTG